MLFIFDMGGVVTNTFKMDSLYNELNLQSKDFFSICKINDVWEQFELGKLSSNDFWQTFNELICKIKKMSQKEQENLRKEYNLSLDLDFSKIPVVETDLFRLYFHPTRQKKTVELIQKLKEKHRVVCGTNTNQSHWENHLECGDYSLFNQTYASNKIGKITEAPNKILFFEKQHKITHKIVNKIGKKTGYCVFESIFAGIFHSERFFTKVEKFCEYSDGI